MSEKNQAEQSERISVNTNGFYGKIPSNSDNIRDFMRRDFDCVKNKGLFLPILQLTEANIKSPSDIELKNLEKPGSKFGTTAINNTGLMFLADNKATKKTPNEDMDEYLRKRKANEDAVRRFINDPENGIFDELKKNPDDNIIKGAIIGFLYTLYAIFINPILSSKALKRKIFWQILVAITIFLMAQWLAPKLEYNINEAAKSTSYGVDDMPDIYK